MLDVQRVRDSSSLQPTIKKPFKIKAIRILRIAFILF